MYNISIWGPYQFRNLYSISFNQLFLLDTLQLAAGATGFFSQGLTAAVVHGCSACALGLILGENYTHSWRDGA